MIIFPQTAYYTPDEEGEKERECTAHFFEGHRNLRIFVREQKSFDLIREHFSLEGKSQVYLVPDIVLYGKGIAGRAGQPSDTINVCIRSDCESTQTDGRKLLAELKGQYPVRGLSTMVKSPLSLKNRKKELSRVFADFAEGKVLVTDRLHAMLFSVLSGTPCIALDNKTGKVFGVADWLKDTGMVILADSSDQVLEILRERRDWPHKGYDRGQLLGEFERMAELIRGD